MLEDLDGLLGRRGTGWNMEISVVCVKMCQIDVGSHSVRKGLTCIRELDGKVCVNNCLDAIQLGELGLEIWSDLCLDFRLDGAIIWMWLFATSFLQHAC